MAISTQTVEAVIAVVENYVTPAMMIQLVEDLRAIPSNRSFRQTVDRIATRARERYIGGLPVSGGRP